MNCARCGRSLKNPAPSGYGPRCLTAVVGSKPARARRVDSKAVRVNERQIEIAFEVRS